MKGLSCLALALVLARGSATGLSGQAAGPPSPAVDIVEVVGCLSESAPGRWLVSRGSEPLVSDTPWTTPAAVADAARRPLGTRDYRLIGISAFRPAPRAGHTVVVKGLLIESPEETRINVTSLQSVRVRCPA
jgi:hypothetical protein